MCQLSGILKELCRQMESYEKEIFSFHLLIYIDLENLSSLVWWQREGEKYFFFFDFVFFFPFWDSLTEFLSNFKLLHSRVLCYLRLSTRQRVKSAFCGSCLWKSVWSYIMFSSLTIVLSMLHKRYLLKV